MVVVPLVALTLEAVEAQVRIHDTFAMPGPAGTAAATTAAGAAQQRAPLRVVDVFVDVGRLCVHAPRTSPAAPAAGAVEAPRGKG
jgi:hypothetical protein